MNRLLFKTGLIAFLVSLTVNLQAQDCFRFLPAEGTVSETTHYDNKDKVSSITKATVLKREEVADEQRVDMRTESQPAEQDTVITHEFSYTCKDGKMYVDMGTLLNDQLTPYQNMQIEVSGDQLELPTQLSAGQELPGGTVVAKVTNNGMPIMTISVTVSNRKVDKQETIKTPAGEFDCYKITQDTESKVGFIKVKGSSAEWYAEGVGVVRSEGYNKKGKLLSYSLLTKLTR